MTVEVLEPRNLLATLTVLSLADGTGGPLTLRDAIANASAGDTIVFAPSLEGAIDLNPADGGQGTLTISKDLTINGPGITIEGGSLPGSSNVQDFSIASGARVTLEDLRISNGNAPDEGGAIDNLGTLTISGSTLSGNAAPRGGAIDNQGTLTVDGSTLSGNSATYGGAIDNHGPVTISGSTLTGNSATFGGAIDNQGTVTISGSTLTGNSARQDGGAINNLGTLTVIGSTLTGNSALRNGGAVNNTGTVTISDSTLTPNFAQRGERIFNSASGRVTIEGNDPATLASKGGGKSDSASVVHEHGGGDSDIQESSAASGHADSAAKGGGGAARRAVIGSDDRSRAAQVVADYGNQSGGMTEEVETPPLATVAPTVLSPSPPTGAPLLVAYVLPGMVVGAVLAQKLGRQHLPGYLESLRTVRSVPRKAGGAPPADAFRETPALARPATISLETQLRARKPLARVGGRVGAIVISILVALVVKYSIALLGPAEHEAEEPPVTVVISHPAVGQAQPSRAQPTQAQPSPPTPPRPAPVPKAPDPGQLYRSGLPVALFNGKDLTGFRSALGDAKQPNNISPAESVGTSNDPVFGVQDGLLRVSGEADGVLLTEKPYENYLLAAEYRWGEQTWPSRSGASRSSGILLHCLAGDDTIPEILPPSIRCCIQEGRTGEFQFVTAGNWRVHRLTVECQEHQVSLPAASPVFSYKPGGTARTLAAGNIYQRDWQERARRDEKGWHAASGAEKPAGEWNTLHCYCYRDTITIQVNGQVVNHATRSAQIRGKIGILSCKAEIFFRRLDLAPLTKN